MSDMRIGNWQQADLKNYKTVNRKSPEGFTDAVEGAVNRVNGLERNANRSILDLLNGKADIHEAMINLQKVDISMRMLLTIRNKAIEAYKEIMHMNF